MILQEYIPNPKPEVPSGKVITLPGQAVDMKSAINQYRAGSLVERAKGYYERAGMEVPQFEKMSKVDQLLALGEYRKTVLEKQLDLQKFKQDALKKESLKKPIKDEQQQGKSNEGKVGDNK